MNNLTELVFILDRSGSMGGLEEDTIGGFNAMIRKQKKEQGEALITTVLFDDQVEVLYDRVPLSRIEPMTDKQYYVRGCTALLDAMGSTIKAVRKKQKNMTEAEVPDKTIFIITTDGQENSSREFSYAKVKELVEKRQRKQGWEFIFLGANMDAVKEAGRFGIAPTRAARYECDSVGTRLNFDVLGNTVSMMRACRSSREMSKMLDEEACLSAIAEDYEARGNK